MKKLYLLLLLIPLCGGVHAQRLLEFRDKNFNFGGKIGLNASFPIVNSLEIDGIQMENIRVQYRVGWQGTLFGRINIDRFFIEPSISFVHMEGDIGFNMPDISADNGSIRQPSNRLTYRSEMLEIPVKLGFYLVREAPYALSVGVGPAVRYNMKTNYTTRMSDLARKYEDDDTRFRIGIATGVGVTIGMLFLNFYYEFGLNEVGSTFRTIDDTVGETETLRFDRRINTMSFSLGVLF